MEKALFINGVYEDVLGLYGEDVTDLNADGVSRKYEPINAPVGEGEAKENGFRVVGCLAGVNGGAVRYRGRQGAAQVQAQAAAGHEDDAAEG